jgi:N-acetylneuraminic acid mutarotase
MLRRLLVLAALCALAPTSVLAAGPGSWRLLAGHMHTPRETFATATAGGLIYAIGGWNQRSGVLSSAEALNPTTGRWTVIASLPAPRAGSCAVGVGGSVYLLGGTADWQPVSDNLVYTSTSKTWTAAAPIPKPVFLEACSRDQAGVIYVFDATNDSSGTGHVYKFNPGLNSWSTMASTVPNKRDSAAAVLAPDGNIYLLGNGPLAMDVYHPTSDTWTTGTPVPLYAGSGQAALWNGQLYTAGGGSEAAVYSFTAQSWSTLTRTGGGLGQLAASGKLYYFGGTRSGPGASAATYEFVP